jgi:hypothetical protein
MNVVLVCINNFQDYILTNISQLIKLKHDSIYVITNSDFFSKFDEFKTKITLIDVNELNESYSYENKNTLHDKDFRNGFNYLTSLRLFYIYELMNKYNINNVIHLENDVLIYYNCDEHLKNIVNENFLYLPFDTYKRNVCSIMYIPNKEVYKQILDNYDFNISDMLNFSIIKEKTNLIKNFPIFIQNENLTEEQNFVSTNSDMFPFIFDGAAIGQYLAGVDPRNDPSYTIGFVNETCVVKYNNYKVWIEYDDNEKRKKPFIIINEKVVLIFNLHIHSKQLHNFV